MASLYEQTLLYDFYHALLSPRQSEVCRLHLYEDWTLSEIAESMQISRQAAHDALQKGLFELEETEHKLGLVKKFKEFDQNLDSFQSQMTEEAYQNLKSILEK